MNMVEQFKEMCEGIRCGREERSRCVTEARQGTRDFLANARKEFQNASKEARQARAHFVKELQAAVGHLRSATRSVMGDYRSQFGQMCDAWVETCRSGAHSPEHAPTEEPTPKKKRKNKEGVE